MKNYDKEVLLILGAGSSFNHGLPLAKDFTEQLLSTQGIRLGGPSNSHVKYMKKFVSAVFAEGKDIKSKQWPTLEELFTCIDLAANSGHSLGEHSPAKLRTMRRALISRTIRMLSQASKRQWKRNKTTENHEINFKRFLTQLDTKKTAVLSMNWDTVVEEGVSKLQDISSIDYGFNIKKIDFKENRSYYPKDEGETLKIVKPHGSINWIYCDCCRETFWSPPSGYESVAQIAFTTQDWEKLKADNADASPTKKRKLCSNCGNDSLGVRLVTFSYKKALDAPMNVQSWFSAENYLKSSPHWVFFGYSLPDADYEFKFLLKRIQLSEKSQPPHITVITKSSPTDTTIDRFKNFFGDTSANRSYFVNGLDEDAMQHLESIGAIRPDEY